MISKGDHISAHREENDQDNEPEPMEAPIWRETRAELINAQKDHTARRRVAHAYDQLVRAAMRMMERAEKSDS